MGTGGYIGERRVVQANQEDYEKRNEEDDLSFCTPPPTSHHISQNYDSALLMAPTRHKQNDFWIYIQRVLFADQWIGQHTYSPGVFRRLHFDLEAEETPLSSTPPTAPQETSVIHDSALLMAPRRQKSSDFWNYIQRVLFADPWPVHHAYSTPASRRLDFDLDVEATCPSNCNGLLR